MSEALMKIFFVRHGETDYNAEGRIQGSIDTDLNSTGIQQAKTVGKQLSSLLCSNSTSNDSSLLFASSCQKRAITTANLIIEQLVQMPQQQVVRLPGLNEMTFGKFEGHNKDEQTTEGEAFRAVCHQWSLENKSAHCDGGESLQEVEDRAWKCFLGLINSCLEMKIKSIVIVGHAGSLRLVICRALSLRRSQVHLENCSIRTLFWHGNESFSETVQQQPSNAVFQRPPISRVSYCTLRNGNIVVTPKQNGTKDFSVWINENSNELGLISREIACHLETDLNQPNYHVKFTSNKHNGQLFIMVFVGVNDADEEGPGKFDICISCDKNNEVSQKTLLGTCGTSKMWIDAQGRNKLIVTPKRHVGSFTELSQEESIDIFKSILDALNICKLKSKDVFSIVFNAGDRRNHSHLHIKCNVEQTALIEARKTKWSGEFNTKWNSVLNIPTETLQKYIIVSSHHRKREVANQQSPSKRQQSTSHL